MGRNGGQMQICINQGDVAERNAQVSMMGRLYSQASRMHAWLGPGADATKSAMAFIRKTVGLPLTHGQRFEFDQFIAICNDGSVRRFYSFFASLAEIFFGISNFYQKREEMMKR